MEAAFIGPLLHSGRVDTEDTGGISRDKAHFFVGSIAVVVDHERHLASLGLHLYGEVLSKLGLQHDGVIDKEGIGSEVEGDVDGRYGVGGKQPHFHLVG